MPLRLVLELDCTVMGSKFSVKSGYWDVCMERCTVMYLTGAYSRDKVFVARGFLVFSMHDHQPGVRRDVRDTGRRLLLQ